MLEKIKEKLGAPLTVFVLQISVVAVIVVAVTAIKFLNGDIYGDLRQWYILNFQDETDVNEVINPEKDETKDITEPKTENISTKGTDAVPVISVSSKTKTSYNYGINSLCVPVSNATISSDYGDRSNPITHSFETHKGLDLAANMGSAIYAAADGVVTIAQKSSSYGNYLVIDHGDGLKTLYAHCSKLNVKAGDTVKKSQVVANVGNTGQSTRPHLHFEVILNGKNLNPNWLINW